MRICFIADFYPTVAPAGGIGTFTRTAAHALAKRGHEIHVLLGRRQKSYDTDDGPIKIHVRRVQWIPVLGRWLEGLGESFSFAWALFWLHRRHRFDVVEFPNWEGTGLISALLRIVPIVVRLHTSTADSVTVMRRPPTIPERFIIFAERTSARHASATVTHSNFHRANMQAVCRLNNIRVIPHGIVIPPLPSLSTRQSLAVLSVGPLSARKGATTLLAAIPFVLEKVPDAEFWLVGGDFEHRAETGFRSAHPEIPMGKVQFLGYLTDERLADLYTNCGVYASAAVYESFGLTFVEAMARGKAVVGCNTSAIPEIVQHQQTGLLVPPNDAPALADAIIRLLVDADLRHQFGTEGRRVAVDSFSAERMAENIEHFFNEVISKRSPSSMLHRQSTYV